MDFKNFDSLKFIGCYFLFVASKHINIPRIVDNVISKVCSYNKSSNLYFFKNDFKLLNNGVSNSEILLGRGFTKQEINEIISNKYIINIHHPDLKYSIFRTKINIIEKIINEDIHNEKFYETMDQMDQYFIQSTSYESNESYPKKQSDDILKSSFDKSLNSSRSFYLWQNMFEIILLESFFKEINFETWHELFRDHGKLFYSLNKNYELSAFIFLCILKLNASKILNNLLTKTVPYEHMKSEDDIETYSSNQTDYINISSYFVLFNIINYHSRFKKIKYNSNDLLNHLLIQKDLCDCNLCHDFSYYFCINKRLTSIQSFEELIKVETYEDNIDIYLSILKKVLYIIRQFWGKNAIDIVEKSVITKNNFNQIYKNHNIINQIHNLEKIALYQFKSAKKIDKSRFSDTLIDCNIRDYDIYDHNKVLCLASFKHWKYVIGIAIIRDSFNDYIFCKNSFLKNIKNIESISFLLYYYLNKYVAEKIHNNQITISFWPNHNFKNDRHQITIFKYQTAGEDYLGFYISSVFLFKLIFLFQNMPVIVQKDIPVIHNNKHSFSDVSDVLIKGLTTRNIKNFETTLISKNINRLSVFCLFYLMKMKNVDYNTNEFERLFIFEQLINRFKKKDLWFYMIQPFVEKSNLILNSDNLELTHFSEIGINIYATLYSFFGNEEYASKTIIDFAAIRLIEKKVKSLIITDSVDKTFMCFLFTMTELRFIIKKSYQFYKDNPTKNYIPFCIFGDNFSEICKMFFTICCMDIFTDDEALFIFLSIRVNDQIETIRNIDVYKKFALVTLDSSKKPMYTRKNLLYHFVCNLIYLCSFSQKFDMNFQNVIRIYNQNVLTDNKIITDQSELKYYQLFGKDQYIGNTSYFQRLVDFDDMYISVQSKKKKKKERLDMFYLAIPIIILKTDEKQQQTEEIDIVEYLKKFEIQLDYEKNYDENFVKTISFPNKIISFMNYLNNCNRIFFEI